MNSSTETTTGQTGVTFQAPVIPPPLIDPAAVEAAIRLIVPDDVTEVRALDAIAGGDRWPRTLSGYFDDPRKAADAVTTIQSAKGVYFTPNADIPRPCAPLLP